MSSAALTRVLPVSLRHFAAFARPRMCRARSISHNRKMATTTNAHYKLPLVRNEPNVHYAPGSAERQKLQDALAEMQAAAPFQVPAFVGGKEVSTVRVRFDFRGYRLLTQSPSTSAGEPVRPAVGAADAARPQEGALHLPDLDPGARC